MTATPIGRLRGLRALVEDAVHHGSLAVERVHMETARRPFSILEKIPPIAVPVQVVHAVHDASVAASYAAVRLVNRAVGRALDAALGVAALGAERDDDNLDGAGAHEQRG